MHICMYMFKVYKCRKHGFVSRKYVALQGMELCGRPTGYERPCRGLYGKPAGHLYRLFTKEGSMDEYVVIPGGKFMKRKNCTITYTLIYMDSNYFNLF